MVSPVSSIRRSPKSTKGQKFWLHLANLPRSFGWQEIKDEARKATPKTVWAEVDSLIPRDWNLCGWIRLEGRKDADVLYGHLISRSIGGHPLRVHYWEIGEVAEFLDCNCASFSIMERAGQNLSMNEESHLGDSLLSTPARRHRNSHGSHPHANLQFQIPTSWPSDSEQCGQYRPLEAGMHYWLTQAPFTQGDVLRTPTKQNYSQASSTRGPFMQTPQRYAYIESITRSTSIEPPATPLSSTSSTDQHHVINASHGTVPVIAKTIFVRNVSYKCTETDVTELLEQAGTLVRCIVPRESADRIKGIAVAKYSTEEEALAAIRMFHEKVFEGRSLEVHMASEKDVDDPSMPREVPRQRPRAPMVVDSSRSQQER